MVEGGFERSPSILEGRGLSTFAKATVKAKGQPKISMYWHLADLI
jgi:hypothetical protein